MKSISYSLVASLFFGSPALAFCVQPSSYSSNQISDRFAWLLCLHNEQVRSLNELSNQNQVLSGQIISLEQRLRAAPSVNNEAAGLNAHKINTLSQLISELTWKVSELEAKVRALEELGSR